MSLATIYTGTVIKRVKYYKDLADKAMQQVDDAALFYQATPESNSIAIIVQHMAGNMLSRWTNFLQEDGEKEWRQRDTEFEVREWTRHALLEVWERGWACFIDAIRSCTEDDLLKTITIRQEPLTVVDAINRQLAHYPYHVGQIVFIAKMIKDSGWESLSIPKNQSQQYNNSTGTKDPAKKF